MIEMTRNRMFPLRMRIEKMGGFEENFKVTHQDQAWLWHLRYGHLNFKGLCLL
jgi:hypothetical protein